MAVEPLCDHRPGHWRYLRLSSLAALTHGATTGLPGYSTRTQVAADIAAVDRRHAPIMAELAAADLNKVRPGTPLDTFAANVDAGRVPLAAPIDLHQRRPPANAVILTWIPAKRPGSWHRPPILFARYDGVGASLFHLCSRPGTRSIT